MPSHETQRRRSISKTCTRWRSGGCRRSPSTSSRAGSRTSAALDRNPAAFHKHKLLPRYLVDVSKRDQSQTIFGHKFNSPFGISPTGSAGLFRRGADMMLAEAAREANIPYIMSGGSNHTIEEAAKVAPNNAWYQLYAARDAKVSDDLIKRAADAGLEALVLTVDVPVHSNRERNTRNGYASIRGNWLQGGAEPQAGAARRGDDPSRLDLRIHPQRRHPAARQLDALCAAGRRGRRGRRSVRPRTGPAHAQTWKELETLPQAVPAQARRQRAS